MIPPSYPGFPPIRCGEGRRFSPIHPNKGSFPNIYELQFVNPPSSKTIQTTIGPVQAKKKSRGRSPATTCAHEIEGEDTSSAGGVCWHCSCGHGMTSLPMSGAHNPEPMMCPALHNAWGERNRSPIREWNLVVSTVPLEVGELVGVWRRRGVGGRGGWCCRWWWPRCPRGGLRGWRWLWNVGR